MSDTRNIRYFAPAPVDMTPADEVLEAIVDDILSPAFDPERVTIEGLIVRHDPDEQHADISLELIQHIIKKLQPDLRLVEKPASLVAREAEAEDIRERIRTLAGMKMMGVSLTDDDQQLMAELKAKRLEVQHEINSQKQRRDIRRLTHTEKQLEAHFLQYYFASRQVVSLDENWRELLPATMDAHGEHVLLENALSEMSRILQVTQQHHAHIARVFADGDAYTIWYKLENAPRKQVTQLHRLNVRENSLLEETKDVTAQRITPEFTASIQREVRDLRVQTAEHLLHTDVFSALSEHHKATVVNRLEQQSRYHRLANVVNEAKRLTRTDQAFAERLAAAHVDIDQLVTQANTIAPLLEKEQQDIENRLIDMGERLLRASEKVNAAVTTPLPVHQSAEFLKLPLIQVMTEFSENELSQDIVKALKQAFALPPDAHGADIMENISRIHDQPRLLAGMNTLLAATRDSASKVLKEFGTQFIDEFRKTAKDHAGYVLKLSLLTPPKIEIDEAYFARQQAEEHGRTQRRLSGELVQTFETEKTTLLAAMDEIPPSSALLATLSTAVDTVKAELEALTHIRALHQEMVESADRARSAMTTSVLPEYQSIAENYLRSAAIYKFEGGTALSTEIKETTAIVGDLHNQLTGEINQLKQLATHFSRYENTQSLKADMDPIMLAIAQRKQTMVDKVSRVMEKAKSAVEQLNHSIDNLHAIYEAINTIVGHWNRDSRHLKPVKDYFATHQTPPPDAEVSQQIKAITEVFHVPASMKVKSEFKPAPKSTSTRLKTAGNRLFDLASRFKRSDRSDDFYTILQNLKELAKDPTLATGIYNADKTATILTALQAFQKTYAATLTHK